jgi:hypothetical protein
MIVFNTLDNTYVTGYVPSMVSEIVCDNYSFAKSAYPTTAVREVEKTDFTIYPNPSTSKFTLNIKEFSDIYTLNINSLDGKKYLYRQIHQPETEISTESLPKGVYMVTIKNNKRTETKKLVIQ